MEERGPQGCACPDGGTACTSISTQYADVSLPLKVEPYAAIRKTQTDCCGEPVVTVQQTCGGGCEITVTQPVCIRITVEYRTAVEAGEPAASCKRVPGCGGMPCR